jgi:hypothetical protein
MADSNAPLTPAEAAAAAVASVTARSTVLAAELTRLGIDADPCPAGAYSGVWLDAEDAELAARVLRWAVSRGLVITRENFGLPGASPSRKKGGS